MGFKFEPDTRHTRFNLGCDTHFGDDKKIGPNTFYRKCLFGCNNV
jgi:hypothetical protein